MAHEQKPHLVFQRNERCHLNWRGVGGGSVQWTTGSRGVRISSSNGSNAGYTNVWGRVQEYWLPTPLACFPFTSPTVRHRVPSGFNWALPSTYAVFVSAIRPSSGTSALNYWTLPVVLAVAIMNWPCRCHHELTGLHHRHLCQFWIVPLVRRPLCKSVCYVVYWDSLESSNRLWPQVVLRLIVAEEWRRTKIGTHMTKSVFVWAPVDLMTCVDLAQYVVHVNYSLNTVWQVMEDFTEKFALLNSLRTGKHLQVLIFSQRRGWGHLYSYTWRRVYG